MCYKSLLLYTYNNVIGYELLNAIGHSEVIVILMHVMQVWSLLAGYET